MKRSLTNLTFLLFLFLVTTQLYAQPGETCANAIPIPGIPFTINGNTCTAVDDYNEICPFIDLGGQDLVYSYTPMANEMIDVTLCTGNTDYDTKLYVYEGVCPPSGTGATGTEFACNDDACDNGALFPNPWVSQLNGLALTAGVTYYFIVDGYDGFACGNFTLDFLPFTPTLHDRLTAVNILLSPTSGFEFDLEVQSIWNPFFDFGSGPGFEGLLAPGSIIDPATLGELPFPGQSIPVINPSYFFWVDNYPFAEFQHSTWFVLMDATDPNPSVFNGGIQVFEQGWWPVIFPQGSPLPLEFFDVQGNRSTDDPPGPFNPEGHIEGPAMATADVTVTPSESSTAAPESQAWGLLVLGSSDQHHINNRTKMENNLRNHYGVDSANIVRANNGNPATKAQVCAAIDSLAAKINTCDKIYVRITSHGSRGSISLPGPDMTAAELCQKMQKLAAKGVPICMVINACFSGTMLDANNWNFPAGSSIITSANDTTSYGKNDYKDGTTAFNESLFVYAFTKCLRDTTDTDGDGIKNADTNRDSIVSDTEAYRWMITNRLCVTWRAGDTSMLYPNGGQRYWDPMPQIREIGRNPTRININVQNLTGVNKTDFHLIFKNDVRGGIPLAWRSNSSDSIQGRWAAGPGKTTVTYDTTKNETMVCWEDAGDPVGNGQFIHFGYRPPGGGLIPVRQYWTPTTTTPAPADRVPTTESSTNTSEPGSLRIRVVNRDVSGDGWGEPIISDIGYRVSPVPIRLEDLNLSNPAVSALPYVPLGTHLLDPDVPFETNLAVPGDIGPNEFIVLETSLSWGLNSNQGTSLAFYDPFDAIVPGECKKDAFEPNDEPLGAPSLFQGAISTFFSSYICPQLDLDHFTYGISAPDVGKEMRVVLKDLAFDADVEVFNPFGLSIASSTLPGDLDEAIQVLITDPGDHVILVSGKNGAWSYNQPYTLIVDLLQPAPLGFTPVKPPVWAPIFKDNDWIEELGVRFFPNPASDDLVIETNLPVTDRVAVVISDAFGRRVMQKSFGMPEGKHNHNLDISRLSEGIYFIEITSSVGTESRKLVVSR